MSSRIIPLLRKETNEIKRDPYTLGIAIILPLIMLFLFGYALNLDVKDISTAVYDLDRSRQSREYAANFENSGYFRIQRYINSYEKARELLERDEVEVVLIIPPDFSNKLAKGSATEVQTLVDGTFPPTAQAAINYAIAINEYYSAKTFADFLILRAGEPPIEEAVEALPRVWYNPSLESKNYIVPGLFAVILMAFPPLLTALAVVREKETGSIQQVFVSPTRPYEFIAGKMIPYGIIAFVEMLIVFLAGVFWFKVPFEGSLPLFLLASFIYVLSAVGMGLLVSTVTKSQVAALVMAIVLTVMPAFLFSGLIFPISSMPYLLQLYAYLFPARYFQEISRSILLKGGGLEHLWSNLVILLFYTFLIFILATSRFKKKLG